MGLYAKEHASQWKPFGFRRFVPPHGPRTPAEELRARFGDRVASGKFKELGRA